MIRVLQELSALDGGGVAKLLFEYYRHMDRSRIQFDFLIYDFYKEGRWDYTFDVYLIPNNDIYNMKVNKSQTFRDQQAEGRRPRFSIKKDIILKKGIRPGYTCNIKTGQIIKY